MSIFSQNFRTLKIRLRVKSSESLDADEYLQISLKIRILLKEFWQKLKAITAFFLSTAELKDYL